MKYPIIAICCAIALCSCKTKKVATDINVVSKNHSELSHYHEIATIDTTRLLHIEDVKQTITIEETITTKKYDKDTGVITEETETTRTIRQDTDKVVAEEEQKGVKSHSEDSLNHIADVSKKVDTSVEEESTGSQDSFGKWLGIVTGLVLGAVVLLVYLRKKLRVS